MPRPIRPDLHPTILVPDTSEARQRARDAVGNRYRVTVYEQSTSIPYVRCFNAFHAWIDWLRSEGETIDHEILNYMTGLLSFADAHPQGSADERGMIPHTLFMPGCRVMTTQKDIANQLGCSEERVRLAIKQLRRCEIIVNVGRGWYEFKAEFFWKGTEAIRLAYLPIQNSFLRTKIEVQH